MSRQKPSIGADPAPMFQLIHTAPQNPSSDRTRTVKQGTLKWG
jgi:hypothetical protein